MEKPKIELRKAKEAKSLSEETPAYSAQVWINGEYFCDVTNHGQGGPDMQHPPKSLGFLGGQSIFYEKLQEMNKLIGETFPQWGSEFSKGETYKRDLEFVCHELLGDLELEKTVKRDLSKRVVFKKSDGKMYEIKPPKGAPSDWQAKMIAAVKSKHGIAKTINEMTLPEAIAEYKAAA